MTSGPGGPSAALRRIVLTGFMGAGKSTVGGLLAGRLGWPFLDVDSVLVSAHGLTVAQLFAQYGEPHFRCLEAEAVARVLDAGHEPPQAVLALGGGAIESESVRRLLFPQTSAAPATVTIFLSAPLPELLARCALSSAGAAAPTRPLLAAPEPLDQRLDRRLPYYRQAHLTVETGGISPEQVVDRIAAWLHASIISRI